MKTRKRQLRSASSPRNTASNVLATDPTTRPSNLNIDQSQHNVELAGTIAGRSRLGGVDRIENGGVARDGFELQGSGAALLGGAERLSRPGGIIPDIGGIENGGIAGRGLDREGSGTDLPGAPGRRSPLGGSVPDVSSIENGGIAVGGLDRSNENRPTSDGRPRQIPWPSHVPRSEGEGPSGPNENRSGPMRSAWPNDVPRPEDEGPGAPPREDPPAGEDPPPREDPSADDDSPPREDPSAGEDPPAGDEPADGGEDITTMPTDEISGNGTPRDIRAVGGNHINPGRGGEDFNGQRGNTIGIGPGGVVNPGEPRGSGTLTEIDPELGRR